MAVDETLAEAFRHNAWATKRLLAFCQDLTPQQLTSSAPGTYGSILDTFNHLIRSDANYLPRAKITRPAWAQDDQDVADLDELVARVDETASVGAIPVRPARRRAPAPSQSRGL
jgi:uncharacterized damage-inducible protein DinB